MLIFRDKDQMIKNQYNTFRLQTAACCMIYIVSLIVILILDKFDVIKYDPTVIFINYDFKVMTSSVIVTGVLSFILSFKPNLIEAIFGLFKKEGER